MISKIEIKNFQSHKDTTIEFSDGVNVLCGESDNGKTAVIRAVKWVAENRPLGVERLNSTWNKGFKDEMSVKIFLDGGVWVERIRTKERNGYSYFENGERVDLGATGTDVPQKVKDLLRFDLVNFQFQLDSPYLLSMSSSEASKYLNEIIKLDGIDKTLSAAESERRSLNSELKILERDAVDCERKIESLSWVNEAAAIQKRIDKYDELISERSRECDVLNSDLESISELSSFFIDLTEQSKLVDAIDSIVISDYSELEFQVKSFEDCENSIVDLSEQSKLADEIDSITITDYSDLSDSIKRYIEIAESFEKMSSDYEKLEMSMPEVCPYCGSLITKGEK